MKKSILFALVFLFTCCCGLFAQEIDIDGIIQSKESEIAVLQTINSALNNAQGSFHKRGEQIASLANFILHEPDFVVDEDDNGEEGIKYFISLLKDRSWVEKLMACIEGFGSMLVSVNNMEEGIDNSDLWSFFSCIVFIILSVMASLSIGSTSLVTPLETSKFETVISNKRNLIPYIEETVSSEPVTPRVIHVVKVDIKEKPAKRVEQSQDSPFKITYNHDEWLELGKGAMLELGSYSNNKEFRNVYSYFQKKTMVMNPRPFDIAVAEADKAMPLLGTKQTGEESILSAVMKAKSSCKYGGSSIDKINPTLLSMDVAYLLSLSDSEGKKSKEDLWANNSWV